MNNNTSVLAKYIALLEELDSLNKDIEGKVICETPDVFIEKNINFFTKSFMVTICAYLENFLKDIIMTVVDSANQKLANSKIPYNLAKWSVLKKKELGELNNADLIFEDLTIKITRKELDDFILGSPYKTENIFKKIGIELSNDKTYREQKDKVNSIVVKRNKIVHHNDNASDISFLDINTNVAIVREYITNLFNLIAAELNR